VTSGCPCIDNHGGESIIPWAVFARERVSTNDASASWEAVARASEPPVASAPAGRLTTSEATSSSSTGSIHAGGPALTHSSNGKGQARVSSAQQQRRRHCWCGGRCGHAGVCRRLTLAPPVSSSDSPGAPAAPCAALCEHGGSPRGEADVAPPRAECHGKPPPFATDLAERLDRLQSLSRWPKLWQCRQRRGNRQIAT
jgi:hypothetical protein